jgi:hypothetical protein
MSVELLSSNQVRIVLNFEEVHHHSVDLLEHFDERGVNVGVAVGSCALTLGRLLGGNDLDEQAEAQFVGAVMQFIGSYFTEGQEN